MAIFGSSSGSSGNVDEIKSTIIKQLQQEAAVNNARQLIGVRTPSLQTSLLPPTICLGLAAQSLTW